MISSTTAPFCSQPWTTMFVQWDGKLTRPCIRGPQSLGSITGVDIEAFWNGDTYQAVREQVRTAACMNEACENCFHNRGRLVDHIRPFEDNIYEFSDHKVRNYFRCANNYKRGMIRLDSRPLVLVMDLSSRCHVRCPKCFVYNSDMQNHLGHMTMETFNTFVPLLSTALLVIGHENGESMLNKNFMDMVSVIKNAGCRFTFNTTGHLFNEANIHSLVALGVDQIMFSIDSIDNNRYEFMHKNGHMLKVMNNIADINRIKDEAGTVLPLLGWYLVASRSNIGELPRMIDRASEIGFSTLYMSHLNHPTREQERTYFDYYERENLRGCDEDRALFLDAAARGREQAQRRGLTFSMGAFP